MTSENPSSFGRRRGRRMRYPGGTGFSSILRTVSRCTPNIREASRMLMPSTMQALLTRR